MDDFPPPLSDVMQPTTIEEIYRAKEERRRRLAALPLTEKVRIMEKLQEAGRTLRAARQRMHRGGEEGGALR